MSVEPDFSSWSLSLEDVARNRWGSSFRPRLEGLAFAPKLVRESRAYDKTPAVMLVASSASALLHRPLFDAVELMEKATGAFKVVVFTDAPASTGLRDYDWAVEHCMGEPDWGVVSARNWLDMASKRLMWASRTYKPAMVIAAIDEETAVSEIQRLGKSFSIAGAVLEGAIAHLRDGLEALPTGEHPTLRGWLGNTTMGEESAHRILSSDYDHVEVRVARRPGRITLITDDSECARDVIEVARPHHWSVVSVSGLDQLDGSARKRIFHTVSSAFIDTLTFFVGTGTVVGPEIMLSGGTIIIDQDASHYGVDLNRVGLRSAKSVDELVQILVYFSKSDIVAASLL